MSSSESAGRSPSDSPDPETPQATQRLKKERIIGLSVILVAFIFALGASKYSAKKTEEAQKQAGEAAQ